MKKIIVLVLCIVLVLPVFSDENDQSTPEDYLEEEFPEWVKDLRRSEIIFFGSIPITFLISSLGVSLFDGGMNIIEGNNFFDARADTTQDGDERIFYISISLSAVIALSDFILGKVQD